MDGISPKQEKMMEVSAVAVLEDGEENEFVFEIERAATDKEIVNKAFEIAYCKYINLDRVMVGY